MKAALLIVDIQNDFVPGGALAVSEGDTLVPTINELQKRFGFVVATQDWHPADHGSFASHYAGKEPGDHIRLNGVDQVLWPPHCVQNTEGAAFVPELETDAFKHITRKGTDPGVDSYSAFFDNAHKQQTDLDPFLREHGISEVFVCGLAQDYCVKFTVLDGLELGYRMHLITDATRPVDLQPGDGEKAIEEVRAAGADIAIADCVQGD